MGLELEAYPIRELDGLCLSVTLYFMHNSFLNTEEGEGWKGRGE